MTRFAVLITLTLAITARADELRTLRAASDPVRARALAAARPGATVLVADGIYADTLLVKVSGAAGKPVTIKAEHPRKAVFSRKGQAARVDASFLRLDGLVFDSQ